RLSGLGPTLVVAPQGQTPFEAYQLLNEPTRPNQTFEGAFAWMVHTQAYAEDEWKNAEQWNQPTSITIAPGATRTYGIEFLLSDQIRNIEKTLIANHRPVAVGIPGYVLPMDLDARLFLNYGHTARAPTMVTQDTRAWIAGLGDEGGSGSWLAAAMKEFGRPNKEEIAKYEQFIDKVLWGGLQYRDGPNKYGVRKSLFYYAPLEVPGFQYDSSLNWTTWSSWKKSEAESIGRGYNYPQVVAAYWSMYRVARNHAGSVT